MWKVSVKEEQCNGCGDCVDSCPGEVYSLRNNKATVVNAEECHGCHTCEAVCEQEACKVEEEEE